MIELLILAAAGGLAVLAAAGEVQEATSKRKTEQRREAEQLAWEAREAELAKLERREMKLTGQTHLLTDQGLDATILERELDMLYIQKLHAQAEDLPER